MHGVKKVSRIDMSHRYLILGLLTERPMTGYDIKKHVKVMLSAVTNASYGTLYPTLHKLQKEGAVEVSEIPQRGRPSKKIYKITDSGREDLTEWLKKPAAADQIRREFLLKLYLAKNLSSKHLRDLITTRRDEVQSMLHALYQEQDEVDNLHQGWVITYAVSQYQAEMDWLDELETQIDSV